MLSDTEAYPFIKEYDNTQEMDFDMQMEMFGLNEVKPEEIINTPNLPEANASFNKTVYVEVAISEAPNEEDEEEAPAFALANEDANEPDQCNVTELHDTLPAPNEEVLTDSKEILARTKDMHRLLLEFVAISVDPKEGGEAGGVAATPTTELHPDRESFIRGKMEMVLKKMRVKEIKEAAKLFDFPKKEHKRDIINQLLDEIVKVD
jgi:hypothetical protein